LSKFLETVPDARKDQGKRYTWTYLLTLVCMGLASGQKTPYAICRWAHWHEEELLDLLQPAYRHIPCASSFYRILRRVDVEALEEAVAAYGQAVEQKMREDAPDSLWESRGWCGVAVDGKEVRGAAKHGPPVRLVSLVSHGSGCVLGQRRVTDKAYEPYALAQWLQGRDLSGMVLTADAAYTYADTAQEVLDQHGDYFLMVKKNQPQLYEDIAFLFAHRPLPGERRWETTSHNKGHGRIETRQVVSSEELNDYLHWPTVGQVAQRTCTRTQVKTGETQQETQYAITSLLHARASASELAQLWRGQWTIENRSHHVRDETMGEDRGQIARGNGPQALAALRNAVLTALRGRGWESIAEALRYHDASVVHSFHLVTTPLDASPLQDQPTFRRL
jgi:predicted transposase YbfD/YdcC